jgi:NTP pyrophosphatase (non-canonical NTP hydrolase)
MDFQISALQQYIRRKDHHPELKEQYFMKLAEEVGELSRAIRLDLRQESGQPIKNTIAEELWDVVYYAIAIANVYDIDLENAINQKEALNREKYRATDN